MIEPGAVGGFGTEGVVENADTLSSRQCVEDGSNHSAVNLSGFFRTDIRCEAGFDAAGFGKFDEDEQKRFEFHRYRRALITAPLSRAGSR